MPINSREAFQATTLPFGGGPDGQSPILIRKGEAVGYCPYVLHRRTDIYGADALSFRPSRWYEPSLKKVHRFAYIPFNEGPRICPGQKFALLEASYTVIRLLQSYQHIEPAVDSLVDEKQTVTLVVQNANGCRVRLTPYSK